MRRAMLLSRGDPMVFLERPISGALIAVTVCVLIFGLWSTLYGRRRSRRLAALAASE